MAPFWEGQMKRIITLSLLALAISAQSSPAGSLMDAIEDSQSAAAVNIISQGADVEEANRAGTTPIIRAAELGLADVVKALIEKNADVNAKSNPGYTALMLAADNGHDEVVKILLKAGADVTARSDAGMTALGYAKAARKHTVAQILRDAGAN